MDPKYQSDQTVKIFNPIFEQLLFRRPYYRRGAGIGIWYGKRRRRRREVSDGDDGFDDQEDFQEPFRILESIERARDLFEDED